MANQAIGFGALLAGGMLVTAAITGGSLADVALGRTNGPKPLGGGTPQTPADTPGQGAGGGGAPSPADKPSDKVTIAQGANRPGVGLTSQILGFANNLAGRVGHIVIGTGTNHSRMTVDGNVSNHWDGNAIDIPATGDTLIQWGQQALIEAGMPESQATRITGGLYNVGPWQIIFNTTEGGDHLTHLHVGYNP